MTPEELMRLAIEKARQGIAAGQSPFGCAIMRGEQLLAVCHNTVLATTDITAHAEVNALRAACQQVESLFLENCFVASTCEPCPMCMSALHWARVAKVCYGATILDAQAAGFNELQFPSSELLRLGGSNVEIVSGVLPEECRALFAEWRRSSHARSY